MTDRQDLEARSERLAKHLVDGRFDDVWSEFDERMAVGLPVSVLARNWQEVEKHKLGRGDATLGRPIVTVTVPVVGRQATVKVDVSYDEADKVAGLYFRWS